MAFRADIVKMIEDLVTKIEDHHFKVNYSMKQDFVTFINSFFKFHLDQSDINFTLNANLLYADTDGVKVIIATDSTMAYAVPGCTIPMRDQIEAFIVVDEVVAYDSYKMRRFRQATRDPSSPVQITTTPVPLASAQATSPFPATAPSQDIFTTVTPPSISSFNISPPVASTQATTAFSTPAVTTSTPSSNFSTPVTTTFSTPAVTTSTPSSFNFSTPPAKTPTSIPSFPTAAVTPTAPSSFNFSTTPTTTSAFHLSTIPVAKTFGSPTNLFNSSR